jgi:predicted enzyme related to lactoylglutathione lyase
MSFCLVPKKLTTPKTFYGGIMVKKLDILILHVKDLSVSVNFYTHILGLKQKDDQTSWKSFRLGDTVLGLQPWHPGTEDERPLKHGISLGFEVENVDKRFKELEKKGAHCLVEPRDDMFGRYAEIVDPDGYIIMLYKTAK